MRIKRLMSALAIATCVTLPTGGGAAAAITAHNVRDASTVQVSAGVYFTAYQNDDLPGATVVLTGAIGDFGEAVSVLPNGMVDPEHSSQLRLGLAQGTFRISIGPLHAKFVNALSHAPYDLKTCSGHAAVTGPAPVVPGSGTGAYTGISGTLELTITGNEVDAKPGCRPFSGSALLAQSIVIAGPGTVSIQ